MSIYEFKPRFQTLLRPLAAGLFRAGVTANQVTVGACVISVALGVGLAAAAAEQQALFVLVPLWSFVRMALNAIDGMLAREFDQASPLGAYLNELTDVVSDCALYIPFALLPGSDSFLVTTVIALSVIAEMAGVLTVTAGGSRRQDGPMGKSDRAFVCGVLGLLVGLGVPLDSAFGAIWAVLAALVGMTIVNRVWRGLAELYWARRMP